MIFAPKWGGGATEPETLSPKTLNHKSQAATPELGCWDPDCKVRVGRARELRPPEADDEVFAAPSGDWTMIVIAIAIYEGIVPLK